MKPELLLMMMIVMSTYSLAGREKRNTKEEITQQEGLRSRYIKKELLKRFAKKIFPYSDKNQHQRQMDEGDKLARMLR